MTLQDFDSLDWTDRSHPDEARERMHRILRDGLAALPAPADSLATLVGDYLPQWKEQRAERFLQDLAADFRQFAGEVNPSQLRDPNFGLMVEAVLRQAVHTDGKEKLKCYRAVLVNACRPKAPGELERGHFLSLLERLKEVHVLVLQVFRDPDAFARQYGPRANGSVPRTLAELLGQYLRPMRLPADLIGSVVHDLDCMGILPGVHGRLGVELPAPLAVQLPAELKSMGQRFVQFISLSPPDTLAETENIPVKPK